MKRQRKRSYKELEAEIKLVEELVKDVCAARDALRRRLQERLSDQSMLVERRQLAANLGQMIEAVSKAIQFIVAKESL